MKLLKLSSNNPGFKTLIFESGLNIVAGLQLTEADKQTYNGIGKSLSLHLIHLMLGSSLDKSDANEKKLSDFLSTYGVFTLNFEHQNKEYKITKDFSEKHYTVNNKKIAKSNYTAELRRILISSDFDINVSFKQLFNVFARRYGGTYYTDALSQQGRPTEDFYQAYTNLAMLGANTDLVHKKAAVKDKLNKLQKAKTVIEGYESLLDESNVKDLKDELKSLIIDKNEFIIAENYDKYIKEANKLTEHINNIRNDIFDISKAIVRKNKNLQDATLENIDFDKVKKIYNEAKFYFKDKVSVHLEQANKFHEDMVSRRAKRMESEISDLKIKTSEFETTLIKIENKRDSILKDLNSKGALEEYNSIIERIRTLESEVRDLDKYSKMLSAFKSDKTKLDLENAKIKLDAVEYLNDTKDHFEAIENKFRTLVKRFYTNHGGGLTVTETDDAKYLFNINVNIPRDGSQGVNEVKIFCYDFLLHQLQPELLGFIAHDGCIFSEMDPRQKSMMVKMAIETIKQGDLQYFINIGESSLEEILDADNKLNILSSDEKTYITKSVILKLFDKDPSEWLFGTSFG
jgi:uncharacterized protein YydD (DUF2326 family)